MYVKLPQESWQQELFYPSPTPEKDEGDEEVGNGQEEWEEKTEEVTAVLVNEREENEEKENEDTEKVEEVWILVSSYS